MTTFKRQEAYKARLKKVWRRPRGLHSKILKGIRGHGRLVKDGYRTAMKDRGKINGLTPVLVNNVEQLKGLNPKQHCIIVGKVGGRRKIAIIEAANGFTFQNAKPQLAAELRKQFEERSSAHKARKEERKKRDKKLEEKLAKEEKKAKESEEPKVEEQSKKEVAPPESKEAKPARKKPAKKAPKKGDA